MGGGLVPDRSTPVPETRFLSFVNDLCYIHNVRTDHVRSMVSAARNSIIKEEQTNLPREVSV
ncbi:hypothetical protein JMJ77_0011238 [Colletotrichum scovillei]|uniref:Uncharacterized protein n=1 Tax=Colletotrichum scovillei TaxID=1209932 RepID=A0A9P7R3B4_9PEZI|nr:hypothetical protein JMJ77_0011238 [Colletotrichum scovillei]KAG7060239.1 hypothetical protein JMJ78_0015514 [Colletotrichum scovillei]KAG7067667.1 hypothetical protein JMJ76_0009095 [Colletotrichum scovillei]